jgi:hypothetical protein
MQGTLVRPSARYPASIAGDSSLKVASNLVQATLVNAVRAGDTLWTFGDTSRLVPDMLMSIDAEIVSITSIAGNVVTVVRGFDGTQPSSHSAGRTAFAYIVAWHHNALAAEITAIETALGANLGNVGGSTGGDLSLIASAYDFPAQSPGGNLIVGANQITLTPVPAGVSGTNTFHYLYVSGGTGTAEACLIVGGTAVSGAASGTVIIQCANTHSGGWTIRTATAGIQEAVKIAEAATDTDTVLVPTGVTVYAPTRVLKSNISIVSAHGGWSVVTTRDASTRNIFEFVGVQFGNLLNNSLAGVQIEVAAGVTKTGGASVYIERCFNCHVNEVWAQDVPDGVICDNSPLTCITNSMFRRLKAGTGRGIVWRGNEAPSNMQVSSCQIEGPPGDNAAAGLMIQNGGGFYIDNTDFLWCGNGLYITPGTGEQVHWVFCDNTSFDTSTCGIAIQPSGTGQAYGLFFTNCWTASHATNGILVNAATGAVDTVRFTSHRSIMNGNHGAVVIAGRNIAFQSSTFFGNSTATPGTYHGIAVLSGCTHIDVTGNNFTRPLAYGNDSHASHIAFGVGASDQITITDNDVSGAVAGAAQKIDMGATGQTIVVRGNRGVPSILNIASAASVNLGNSPGDVYAISGTVPIATMTPAWEGRDVFLLFTDVAPGGVAAGGAAPSFRKARTAAALDFVHCKFINGQWSPVL